MHKFCVIKANDRYFEDECLEVDMLDKTHNLMLYDKVKNYNLRNNHIVLQQVKDC